MKKLFTAFAALLTLVSLAFSAGPANAYPTGKALTVNLSSDTLDAGQSVTIFATNAYPNCAVTFETKLGTTTISTNVLTASVSGTTGTFTLTRLKLGRYTVTGSYNCNGKTETDTANLLVGRITSTTANLAINVNALTASGKITWGATGVSGMSGTVVFNSPTGVTLYTGKVRSDKNGNYSSSYSSRKALAAGTYTAVVTFVNSVDYFGSTKTATQTKALVIKLATVKLQKIK